MKWVKITVETTTEATDMISYVLSEYGVEGIEIKDNIPLSEEDKQAMFIDILPELPPDDGTAYISCYIEDKKDVRELCNYIENHLKEMSSYMNVGTGAISISSTDDKDWIDKWKDFFKPIRIEDNIVIQPTWTEPADTRENDIVIHIDPGTAFGTGAHETTRLCIGMLKQYIKEYNDPRVLDAGCGSGILSIVSAKLGARNIVGFDIDELAVEASESNLEINDINKNMYSILKGNIIGDDTFAKTVLDFGQYDIIVANILADVIIPLSGIVKPLMKKNGIFISSGIIDTKEKQVIDALEKNGLVITKVIHLGEWVSVAAKKSDDEQL